MKNLFLDCFLLNFFLVFRSNSADPDQTAPVGAV